MVLAAIHTSAASTIFLPIAWTPASSWATVPDPSGRDTAFAQLGIQLLERLHAPTLRGDEVSLAGASSGDAARDLTHWVKP